MSRQEFEVVVIGAGAAGIGAARRLRDAGVKTLLVEARTRLGGRAWTVVDPAGAPMDVGCGWLHSADRNPWAPIAEAQGLTVDRTPPPWGRASSLVGLDAKDGAEFGEALQNFRGDVDAAAEAVSDRAAASLLRPGDPWNHLINAVSTWYSGVELDRVSVRDLARYDDSGVNWRVTEGYGTAVANHAAGVRVELDCVVQRIDRRGRQLRLETTRGAISADVAIVTLPSNVVAETPDFFMPALPDKTEAAAGLPLGLADKLYLSLSGAEEFKKESRAFGASDRTRTGAYHFRPFGRPVIEAFFGGDLAADLEKGGDGAFFDFAAAEFVTLFGGDFARRVKPLYAHGWRGDPFARGSYSCALPGRADCRALLAATVENRLFFAGEACSLTDFSTAHGAYLTGVVAADMAIGAVRNPAP
jgi:monoamine oxidase